MTSQPKQQDVSEDGSETFLRKKSTHHRAKWPPKSKIPVPSKKSDKVKVVDSKCGQRMLRKNSGASLASYSKTLERNKTPLKDECVDVGNDPDRNEGFLESYIINHVSINQLERWLIKKRCLSSVAKSRFGEKSLEKISKKNNFLELLTKLKEETNEHSIVLELARLISMSIGVEAYKVYKLYPDRDDSVEYFDTVSDKVTRLVRVNLKNIEHVLHVAEKGCCLRLARDDNTTTFPEIPISLLDALGVKKAEQANHVLYLPLLRANWKTGYVIEMWRTTKKFDNRDQDTSSDLIVWGSIILHYCSLYLEKEHERKMSDFLFEVVEDIFEEKVSPDQLIRKILRFAQKLVKAYRACLSLDKKEFRGLETYFYDLYDDSGQKMNRKNRDVDVHTDYTSRNELCMEVKVQGKVIADVKMINKINNQRFDDEDDIELKKCLSIFGLALHHAVLTKSVIRNENRYKVTLEMITYHNTCKKHEVDFFLENSQDIKEDVDSLNDFNLDPYKLNDIQKCKAVITMFYDLFEISNFDYMTLTKFILTVKKNYRAVPYHNFDHGWSVANSMYVIIKKDNKNCLDYTMRLALFVSSLCHDLDHRGYTDAYLNKITSPLAAMYTTSPLEHHHFNITATILQLEEYNIFSRLSTQEYKYTLGYIKKCILATNLAAFFPNLEKINEINSMDLQDSSFNWAIPNHRELGMAISMTAADLSASAKPWKIQLKTVKIIFEEFYDQGDKEKKAGTTPIAMMDRDRPEEQPASQVEFLSSISIPCYTTLYKILPETKPLYTMACRNLHIWKSRHRMESKLSIKTIKISSLDNTGEDEFSSKDTSELLLGSKVDKDADLEKCHSLLEKL